MKEAGVEEEIFVDGQTAVEECLVGDYADLLVVCLAPLVGRVLVEEDGAFVGFDCISEQIEQG